MDLSIVIKQANVNFQAQGVVRHCAPAAPGSPHPYVLGIEFTAGHENGLPFLENGRQKKQVQIDTTVSIDADLETCWRFITPDRFPQWVSGVESASVKTRHPDGRPKQVEFVHNMLLRKASYTDEFSYDDQNHVLSWTTVAAISDLVKNEGNYTLKSFAAGRTMLTFHLDITLAYVPSKRIITFFTSIMVRKEMKSFKKFVEQNAKP